MKKQTKLFCVSNYLLICPDKPVGGKFEAGETYIDETGVIEDVGPEVPEYLKTLKGKRVIFNAWACDQKTVDGHRYYFAPADANAICATI